MSTDENTTEKPVGQAATKQSFREKIWIHMAEKGLANSIRSLCYRIPYYKGAAEASQRLIGLDEFKNARLVMISPDKPLEPIIISSLEKEKEILIPKPRLLSGLFLRLKNATKLPEEDTTNVVTRHGIKQIETPVGFDATDLKVDLLVLGSVCVNRDGYRIGDGEGFADMEFAILSKMKAVDENTLIVTTVHDSQILDDLPNDIFEPHDVPVDVIVTPTQTLFINPKLKKPTEIIWSAISKRRLTAIPILKEIKELEEKDGKILSLKEVDSDIESRLEDKIRIKKAIFKSLPPNKVRRKKINSESVLKESEKSKEIKKRPFIKKRRLQKSKENNDENDNAQDKVTENQPNASSKPQRQRSNLSRNHVDFSLRLSNIASTVRVRDLKSALLERGVKPSNITWRGQRGFCYLHFGKLRKKNSEEDQPVQVDSIVANLQQLKVGEAAPTSENGFITVEPAEPVTRIEVTDISAV